MKRLLLISFIVLSFLNKGYSCSPYGVPTLTNQSVSATNLVLNWISTTGWSCNYNVVTEIFCSPSGGVPLVSDVSGCISKPNSGNIAYPSAQSINLSGLCPGETYYFRAKETSCGSSGGGSSWTQFFSFVYGTSGAFQVTAGASSLAICLGNCVDLSAIGANNCQPLITYSWDNGVGAGATPNVCPATTTTYTVTASTTGICATLTATNPVTITVDTPPIAGTAVAAPDHVCLGDVTNLSLAGYNGNLQWQSSTTSATGPWTNEVGATSDTYTTLPINGITYYQVDIYNGCGSIYSNVITVFPEPFPIIDFSMNDECLYDAVSFINNTSITSGNIVSWLWDLGNGNTSSVQNPPDETYLIEGTYNVSLTATSDYNCTSNLILPVVLHPIPMSNFSTADVCNYSSASFTDLTTITSGAITAWNWDFGDGNSSIIQNPTNLYANYGTYSPSLTTTSDMGCVNTFTFTNGLNIHEVPQANFNFNNVCEYDPGSFTDLTIMNTESMLWTWDFGDGNNSNLQNPTNLYSTEGTYNVELLVESASGCLDSISQQIIIHPQPVTSFTVTDDCLYNNIVMTDASTVVTGNIANWNWNFGDGSTSVQQNTAHLYNNDGTYDVTLVITTNEGCIDILTQQTIVHPVPNVNFIVPPVCLYDSAVFTDFTTINAPGNLVSWLWSFGDGSPIVSNQNETHLFPSEGNYDVTLIVTSDLGCVKQLTQQLMIYPIPVANFLNDTICVNTPPTSFTDISTITFGSAVLWNWDFGNGNTSNLQNPVNSYYVDGQYDALLTVTSDFGCVDDTTIQVIIYEKPFAAFFPSDDDICNGDPITFQDSSTSVSADIIAWQWNFGDGTTSTEEMPTMTYNNGSYTNDEYFDVELIAMNDLGCYDTVFEPNRIVVRPTPFADFYPDPASTNMYETEVNFVNTAIGAESYSWDLSDNAISTNYEPTHLYSDTGTYYVTQTAITQYGCIDSITKPVVIVPVINIYVPNSFTPNGDGLNDDFFVRGFGITNGGFSFHIFNRWGEEIYKTNGFYPWDGRHKNRLVKSDVYVWALRCKDVFGKVHEYIGHVTVLR